MAVRKFNYEFDGVHYYRFSIYRLGSNVQTVYTFIVDDLLIDTAQRYNRENILKVAQQHDVKKIILTHHHEDHTGNVAFLMNELKIDAYAHPNAVKILGKGYRMSPLAKLMNGSVEKATLKPIAENDIIETEHYSLQPIYTPGHCDDHYCYYENNKGWLQYFEDFAGTVTSYYEQGHNARQIFALMGMKENYVNKYITLGGFCAENMVHSVVRDLKNRK